MNRISKKILSIIIVFIGILIGARAYDLSDNVNIMMALFLIGGGVVVLGILLYPPKEHPLDKFNKRVAKNSYYCEKCNGVTPYENYCANPDCPNQPCCGKPEEECTCYEPDATIS